MLAWVLEGMEVSLRFLFDSPRHQLSRFMLLIRRVCNPKECEPAPGGDMSSLTPWMSTHLDCASSVRARRSATLTSGCAPKPPWAIGKSGRSSSVTEAKIVGTPRLDVMSRTTGDK